MPLVELVNQAHIASKSPINLVDVGAAVGDTVLLLSSNCGEMVGHFLCIDGDPEFFGYLQENLAEDANVTVFMALLSSSEKTERSLVRTHAGTASAQGRGEIHATTLDALIAEWGKRPVHVLKIDVDGFDGRVLRGGPRLLAENRPAVIFEWHPILCRQTGNSHDDHFEMLREHGYTRFLWFTKFGDFSHFTEGEERVSRALMAELCFRGKHSKDWHYDVIALHDTSSIDPLALAELPSRKLRKSPW
jgi:FkbM family methyltransferase